MCYAVSMIWQCRRGAVEIPEQGMIMGILNVTPDSFSDGGEFFDEGLALKHGLELIRDGANIVDVGGESTRPGARPVSLNDEIDRVVPVIAALRVQSDVLISVDTRHTKVAAAALAAGADIVNDVAGLSDEGMAELCVKERCGVVVMHMQGTPETMQLAPQYDNVVAEVRAYFELRYRELLALGLLPEQICWDPGIGFGKTVEHNLQLIAHLSELRVAQRPLLMGLSRKRFLSHLMERGVIPEEMSPTLAMSLVAHVQGADIHRVHDVEELAQPKTRKRLAWMGFVLDL